jgi:anti-sigma regulatory factor (Ser/Thr protein kinase)
MTEPRWRQAAPPATRDSGTHLFRATISRAADLTATRQRLAVQVTADLSLRPDDEGIERLLLTFEELTRQGFRHGGSPVEVTVTTTDAGWLIVVTDAAAERPPTPAVRRDPATGGLGLHLIARLAVAVGWTADVGGKQVWAFLRRSGPS